MAGKDLPAVLYNILANSLEEKILHMASACTVFGQQKMIKVSLKMVSCVVSEGGSSRRERKKEEEDALVERHEREQYISEKGLKKI